MVLIPIDMFPIHPKNVHAIILVLDNVLVVDLVHAIQVDMHQLQVYILDHAMDHVHHHQVDIPDHVMDHVHHHQVDTHHLHLVLDQFKMILNPIHD